jgi:anti-sigma B factor antagonist
MEGRGGDTDEMPVNKRESVLGAAVPQEDGATVDVRHVDAETAVCVLAGELDIETLGSAKRTLRELVREGMRLVVVDLQRIEFCDSSGLNMLLQARMAAEDKSVGLRLAGCSPAVMRVLELTGADTVFSLHPDVDAALAARQ